MKGYYLKIRLLQVHRDYIRFLILQTAQVKVLATSKLDKLAEYEVVGTNQGVYNRAIYSQR